MSPGEKRELESLFSTLSISKQRFLEARLYLKSDKESAEQIEVSERLVRLWKEKDPAFKTCYTTITTKMFDMEKNIVMAVERSNAVIAVREKQRLLSKKWEDCSARESAAKTTLIQDTLERVAPKKSATEQTVAISIVDILKSDEPEEQE